MNKFISAIRKSLTPDLLSPQWKPFADKHCTGHCYVAAEALFHLMGGKRAKLKAYVHSFTEKGMACTHWWIADKNGKIHDPTKCQYTAYGKQPSYHKGRACGFLTKEPSKRALIVINRVKKLLAKEK